jgi:hypothetical protein
MSFDWFYGIWFVGGAESDWLAGIGKIGNKWVLKYRFRYYNKDSTNPFDKKDEKSWYGFETPDDSEESLKKLVATTDTVAQLNEMKFGAKVDFVLFQCDPSDPKLFFELGSRSWSHVER